MSRDNLGALSSYISCLKEDKQHFIPNNFHSKFPTRVHEENPHRSFANPVLTTVLVLSEECPSSSIFGPSTWSWHGRCKHCHCSCSSSSSSSSKKISERAARQRQRDLDLARRCRSLDRARKTSKHKHLGRDGVRDKQEPSLGQTGPVCGTTVHSLFSSTVKSPFCPVCPWDGWRFVPGTIVPQGPSEKCECVLCLLVIFAPN